MRKLLSGVDTSLLEHANEILSYDKRFSRCSFDLDIQGQVAHVTGTVSHNDDQFMIRKALSRLKGIYAIWDMITVNGQSPPVIFDIGCGNQKQYSNFIGIDRFPCDGVDIVADLERPLPVRDDAADHVFAIHVLEHIHHLIELMNELHRIIKLNGVLHLMVPRAQSDNAVGDPTHVRFFNKKTVAFFCRQAARINPFKPLCVSEDNATIYADLTPVKNGQPLLDEKEFAYYFE
ncbi:MAG: methyltransferase domain-containing protein [Candidatus Omnitrophota bacterium]